MLNLWKIGPKTVQSNSQYDEMLWIQWLAGGKMF